MKLFLLSLSIFIIDQISKISVRGFSIPFFNINVDGLYPGESKTVIENIFHITLVENSGIAFGIDPGESLKDIILVLTILTCIGFFIYLILAKQKDIKFRLAIACILGGAVGNLFDRIFYGVLYGYAPLFQGNVVDFLDIRLIKFFLFGNIQGNYVFNFADISILFGVFLLIYLIVSSKKHKDVSELVPQVVDNKEDSN